MHAAPHHRVDFITRSSRPSTIVLPSTVVWTSPQALRFCRQKQQNKTTNKQRALGVGAAASAGPPPALRLRSFRVIAVLVSYRSSFRSSRHHCYNIYIYISMAQGRDTIAVASTSAPCSSTPGFGFRRSAPGLQSPTFGSQPSAPGLRLPIFGPRLAPPSLRPLVFGPGCRPLGFGPRASVPEQHR